MASIPLQIIRDGNQQDRVYYSNDQPPSSSSAHPVMNGLLIHQEENDVIEPDVNHMKMVSTYRLPKWEHYQESYAHLPLPVTYTIYYWNTTSRREKTWCCVAILACTILSFTASLYVAAKGQNAKSIQDLVSRQ
jgi:hypothetical protein